MKQAQLEEQLASLEDKLEDTDAITIHTSNQPFDAFLL